MTHPFHPLSGREFEFVEHRHSLMRQLKQHFLTTRLTEALAIHAGFFS